MGKLLDGVNSYFENTSDDVLEKDFAEIKHLNEIGPDVIEYAEAVNKYFGSEVWMPYYDFCIVDVPVFPEVTSYDVCCIQEEAEEDYYLAA